MLEVVVRSDVIGDSKTPSRKTWQKQDSCEKDWDTLCFGDDGSLVS